MTLSGPARMLVAVATGVTLALSLSAAPGEARSRADGPDFGAPTVGACSTMTPEQAGEETQKGLDSWYKPKQ